MQYTRLGNIANSTTTSGGASVSLSFEEIRELDEFSAPTPLYPNWFQTFATDTAVRDALEPNRKS